MVRWLVLSSHQVVWIAAIAGVSLCLNPAITAAESVPAEPMFLAQASAQGNVFMVDPKAGNDAIANGSPQAPFKTLTRALEVAPANTIIQLSPGVYSAENGETFPIRLKPGVIIQGDPQSRGQNIVIQGSGFFLSPTFARQKVAVLGANQATITGVTITNPAPQGYGLWVESTSPAVMDSTFTGSDHDGIAVNGSGSPLIRNNYFYHNGANGITIYGTSRPEVRENVFERTGFGINVSQNAAPLLVGNRVTQNKDGIVVQIKARPVLRQNFVEGNERDGLVAIAQSCPDLGTATDPGGNFFRNNGQLDINAKSSSETIPAVGNEMTKTSGKLDLNATGSTGSVPQSAVPAPPQAIAIAASQPLLSAASSASSASPTPPTTQSFPTPPTTQSSPTPPTTQSFPTPRQPDGGTSAAMFPTPAALGGESTASSVPRPLQVVALPPPAPALPPARIIPAPVETAVPVPVPPAPMRSVLPVAAPQSMPTPVTPAPMRSPLPATAPRSIPVPPPANRGQSLPMQGYSPFPQAAAPQTTAPVQPTVNLATSSRRLAAPPPIALSQPAAIPIPVPVPESRSFPTRAIAASTPPKTVGATFPTTPAATPIGVLPVPGPNIPLGNVGDMPEIPIYRNPRQRQTASPVLQSAPVNVAGYPYRVVVDARSDDELAKVRSLVPGAFRSSFQGRPVLQVGAFAEPQPANELVQQLAGQGIPAILETRN